MAKISNVSTTLPQAEIKWVPPKAPWVKKNWDATAFKEGQIWDIGIIVRDSFNRVLACQSSSCTLNIDPLLAECEALSRALQLCEELGLNRVCLKGDAKHAID